MLTVTHIDMLNTNIGVLNCVRALGGYTVSSSAATAFDTDGFKDIDYVAHVIRTSGNVPLALGW